MLLRNALLTVACLMIALPAAWGGTYADPEVDDPAAEGGSVNVQKAWVESDAGSPTFDIVVLLTGATHPWVRLGYCLDSNGAEQCYDAEVQVKTVPATRWAPSHPDDFDQDFDCETIGPASFGPTSVRGVAAFSAREGTYLTLTLSKAAHDVTAIDWDLTFDRCEGVTRGGAGIQSGDTLSCLQVLGYSNLLVAGSGGATIGGCLESSAFVFP